MTRYSVILAVRDFKMSSKNAEEAFLTRGYNNWKAATDAFRKHESSTDALDLEEAAREFIVNSEHRQRIFGAF